MKRISAILCAALLLAALAFGCGGEPAAVQLPDPTDDYDWTTPTLPETETELTEPTDVDPLAPETYTSIVYYTVAPSTKAGTATTKAPALSGNAPATKATTTSTTKGSTTTRGSTKYYANGITIDSRDTALSAFNAAVKRAIDSKAGFAKSHLITYKDWAFDQELLAGLPSMGGFFDPNAYLTGALNSALGKGARTATAHKGDGHTLMKNSSLTMGDLKDVTYSGAAGGDWTITLTVKDGETRQEKRLLGNRATGNSPIDKGPLHQATGDGNIYDHMDADKIFSLMGSIPAVTPIDISESTAQVKITARLDGEGKLIELKATYNQTINLKEVRLLNGVQSYKDNVGSSTVTVTYDAFAY